MTENEKVEAQQPQSESKPGDKELNFRALEQKYKNALEQERLARLQAEEKAAKLSQVSSDDDDDDDDDDYVQKKKLKKKLEKFEKATHQRTQSDIQSAVQAALADERRQNWVKQNSDFYEVLQHADKLADQDPELAETILQMPDGFERQKLVYKNIKLLGLHKPKEASVQQKIDSNRRSPFYQPTNQNSAPYSAQGDFSQEGQKKAYENLMRLKNSLRI